MSTEKIAKSEILDLASLTNDIRDIKNWVSFGNNQLDEINIQIQKIINLLEGFAQEDREPTELDDD